MKPTNVPKAEKPQNVFLYDAGIKGLTEKIITIKKLETLAHNIYLFL